MFHEWGILMKQMGKRIWLICVVGIVTMYFVFIFVYNHLDHGEAPVISFDNDLLELSVNDDVAILMAGVNANDKEDGDLAQDVIIENISPFDQDKNRVVTYAVFDSDRHVTKASRMIHYNDYSKPRIYLKEAFLSNNMTTANINKIVGANSSVDGDISNKVTVQLTASSKPREYNVQVSVKDSTGTSESLNLVFNYDSNVYTTDIILNNYLVYLKAGERFNAYSNIKEIDSNSVKNNERDYINVVSDVNSNVPGVYEVMYSFNHSNDSGLTKCIVVVE